LRRAGDPSGDLDHSARTWWSTIKMWLAPPATPLQWTLLGDFIVETLQLPLARRSDVSDLNGDIMLLLMDSDQQIVSLTVQRSALEDYAKNHGLNMTASSQMFSAAYDVIISSADRIYDRYPLPKPSRIHLRHRTSTVERISEPNDQSSLARYLVFAE
jgi:hypothetical protein